MIRLIILALGVFLIWVLFASSFNRSRKILISVAVAIVALAALWWESSADAPKLGRIQNQQIEVCGTSARHTYRTNFDINFCLRNLSDSSTVKRVTLSFIAQRCDVAGACEVLQSNNKSIVITISPLSEINYIENLNFDQVDLGDASISWKVEVNAVEAV